MAGIKEYFNVTLGSLLLYKFERPQYSEVRKYDGKPVKVALLRLDACRFYRFWRPILTRRCAKFMEPVTCWECSVSAKKNTVRFSRNFLSFLINSSPRINAGIHTAWRKVGPTAARTPTGFFKVSDDYDFDDELTIAPQTSSAFIGFHRFLYPMQIRLVIRLSSNSSHFFSLSIMF